MERVGAEPLRLLYPDFANVFVWREPFERPEPTSEIVGGDEVGTMPPELIVVVIMEAVDRCLFQRAIHSFDVAVIRYVIGGAFLARLRFFCAFQRAAL
jgi:hypothetical protein